MGRVRSDAMHMSARTRPRLFQRLSPAKIPSKRRVTDRRSQSDSLLRRVAVRPAALPRQMGSKLQGTRPPTRELSVDI